MTIPIQASPGLSKLAEQIRDELMLFTRFTNDAHLLMLHHEVDGIRLAIVTKNNSASYINRSFSDDPKDLIAATFGGGIQAWLTHWGPFDAGASVQLKCTGHEYAKQRVLFGGQYLQDDTQFLNPWFEQRQNVYGYGMVQLVNPALLRQ